MSHIVKMQKVQRGSTRSFYLNFPAALADAMGIEKAEAFEWRLEDKNTVWLRRCQARPPHHPPKKRTRSS